MRFQWSVKRLMIAVAAVAGLIALGFEVVGCRKCLREAAYHRRASEHLREMLSDSEGWVGMLESDAKADPELTSELQGARQLDENIRKISSITNDTRGDTSTWPHGRGCPPRNLRLRSSFR
jgi:hypothetical protein